jgi:crotonobetainyl-CoA:carnitine CoA-transferase CaiB-like acyl-CoA transferase
MALLEGVRVLDMGWVLGGPFAGQLLAQMGADVVKIESPEGDLARGIPPHFADGESSFFLSVNRGKRSVAIDLKQPHGRAVFEDLVRRSDAVIHNFAPDVPKRLGVDLQALKKINPRICVGQLIGFHDEGEYRNTPAFDLVIQAQSGFMSLTGERGGKPVRAGYQVADLAGGLYLALGLVGALLGAARTGEGREVQVSLFDCQIALLTWQAQNYFISGEVPRRNGSRHHMIAPSEVFAGSDGRYFVISPTGDAFFGKFSIAIGHAELADDERFATGAGRIAHVDALAETLQSIFSTKPAASWVDLLKAERIPAGLLNDVDGALGHDVTALRGMVETLVNPATGNDLSFLGNPFKWAGNKPLSYPPRLGEHTRAVLAEVCAYDASRIDELVREGAVATGERK